MKLKGIWWGSFIKPWPVTGTQKFCDGLNAHLRGMFKLNRVAQVMFPFTINGFKMSRAVIRTKNTEHVR